MIAIGPHTKFWGKFRFAAEFPGPIPGPISLVQCREPRDLSRRALQGIATEGCILRRLARAGQIEFGSVSMNLSILLYLITSLFMCRSPHDSRFRLASSVSASIGPGNRSNIPLE